MMAEPSLSLCESPEEHNLWSSWQTGRNARQTNLIEELQTCSDEHAIHNKFRSIAFSKSVQTTFVRPVFDAVVVTVINSGAGKLNLLLLYQTQKQAWELKKALCLHQQVMSSEQVVWLPYWYQYQSRHSKTSHPSARHTRMDGWKFFLICTEFSQCGGQYSLFCKDCRRRWACNFIKNWCKYHGRCPNACFDPVQHTWNFFWY